MESLMSPSQQLAQLPSNHRLRRHHHHHHHLPRRSPPPPSPRPLLSDLLGGSIVLLDTVPVRPTAHVPRQPFRLLSLPGEIRQMIYAHHFGLWEVTLDYERLTMLRSKFLVRGVPTLDLLLTCRQLYRETRDVRLRTFTGRLNLHNVFILVPLRRKPHFEWLRQNVRTLHFSDSSVHPERWNRYYDNFPSLRRLEIEFPHIVRLVDRRCAALDEVLDGRHDALLLESLDAFRLALVEQLSEMVQVGVSQKYCLSEIVEHGWTGILDVKIQLTNSGAQIVARRHDDGVSVLSKRQFRRPSEL